MYTSIREKLSTPGDYWRLDCLVGETDYQNLKRLFYFMVTMVCLTLDSKQQLIRFIFFIVLQDGVLSNKILIENFSIRKTGDIDSWYNYKNR